MGRRRSRDATNSLDGRLLAPVLLHDGSETVCRKRENPKIVRAGHSLRGEHRVDNCPFGRLNRRGEQRRDAPVREHTDGGTVAGGRGAGVRRREGNENVTRRILAPSTHPAYAKRHPRRDALQLVRKQRRVRGDDDDDRPCSVIVVPARARRVAETSLTGLRRIPAGDARLQILNLLANAVKYSGDARQIEMRLGRRGSEAFIDVVDQGLGISPEDQTRIFEKFYRVRSAETDRIAGTGLGLTLALHIIEAHKGRLEVSSEVGRGSTFSVRIPLQEPA